jgi:hypothetical protein
MARKPSKYKNVPTVVDGIRFASKREATAYETLRLLERAGRLSELRRQVVYCLMVNGALAAKYVADFVYKDAVTGLPVVCDAKGYRTDVYKLKKRLMKLCLGIEVVEL